MLPAASFTVAILLIYSALVDRDRQLWVRLQPYLHDRHHWRDPRTHWWTRMMRWWLPVWEKTGSTGQSIRRRLGQIRSPMTVERFRLVQFLCGIAAMVLMSLILATVTAIRSVSLIQWVTLIGVAFFVGALGADRYLTILVKRHADRVAQQVADTAELLALSISAGESVPAALARVTRVSGEELAGQLSGALEAIESGVAVTRALSSLSAGTHCPQLARLLDTLISAAERGAPLSTVLREQARDLRDESRRELIEAGGRKEIAMLIPVVFIILPITIIFALYPGLMALRL